MHENLQSAPSPSHKIQAVNVQLCRFLQTNSKSYFWAIKDIFF